MFGSKEGQTLTRLVRRVALPTAEASQIEGRLRAILCVQYRRTMKRSTVGVSCLTAIGILLPLAALRPAPLIKSRSDELTRRLGVFPASAYEARFPGGIRLALVGVSAPLRKGWSKRWWKPNGTMLTEPPYDVRTGAAIDQTEETPKERRPGMREFAFQMTKSPGSDFQWDWNVFGARQLRFGSFPYLHGEMREDIEPIAAFYPSSERQASIRVGIASGEWRTVQALPAGKRGAPKSSKFGIYWTSPQAESLTKFIMWSAADPDLEPNGAEVQQQYRLIGVGRNGRRYLPHHYFPHKIQFDHSTVYFDDPISGKMPPPAFQLDVPYTQIRHFEVQSRPYSWVEFRNISLQPRGSQGSKASSTAL